MYSNEWWSENKPHQTTVWPLVQNYRELNWSFLNLYALIALKATTAPAFHVSSPVWEGSGLWWRCARESLLREESCWDVQEGNQGSPCSNTCKPSSKLTHFWLQYGRFRQLLMVSPGLRGCWAGVFFCLCELWALAHFLRYLQRRVFENTVSTCFTLHILRVCVCVYLCEKIMKVFISSLKCHCIHLKQWNKITHCSFFIWHSERTWVLMGKM